MPIEIRKKGKESSINLVRRFKRAIQQSGLLQRARKRMFKEREKSRELKKRSALRREEMKQKYEKLKKLGQL